LELGFGSGGTQFLRSTADEQDIERDDHQHQ
jgi:hypothetical protein